MKTIHPFPARMAPGIVYECLPETCREQYVLDPMTGSGTTVAVARSRGFNAVGSDTDPLAITIARANAGNIDVVRTRKRAAQMLASAQRRARLIKPDNAYPDYADDETRDFIDFWFDRRARVELTALSRTLFDLGLDSDVYLKCAYSRMIITKKRGVSKAEDVSHSRPHVKRKHPPVYPLQIFDHCVETVIEAAAFKEKANLPRASVVKADCRKLPFDDAKFDYIITSPPYLNAIDYLRGHKLSLVWLGHTIAGLRDLRSSNVGCDGGHEDDAMDNIVEAMVTSDEKPSQSLRNRLRRYVSDLDEAIAEMRRVAKSGASLVMVVGDSTIKGCDIQNSIAVDHIAQHHGFAFLGRAIRPLLQSRRYLPPPSMKLSGKSLRKRMWNEIVLTYQAQ